MAQRQDDNAGTPANGSVWYTKLVGLIIDKAGVVALIALALIWFVISTVERSLDSIKNDMSASRAEMSKFAVRHDEFNAARRALDEKLLAVMRQNCVNGAKTQEAINRCLQ